MEKNKVVAVMQPYLFPYIGYFQLINESDVFVFYDDVDFIKQGWINRNRILINGDDHTFTIPCHNASSNEKIKNVLVHKDWKSNKLLKKIKITYSNAKNFDKSFPTIKEVLNNRKNKISELAQKSVKLVCNHLSLDTDFYKSSKLPVDSSLGRAERLIKLTKHFAADTYVNMEGGEDLYSRSNFTSEGVNLKFLEPSFPKYDQYGHDDFEPGLSIIDIIMNNSNKEVNKMISKYKLK